MAKVLPDRDIKRLIGTVLLDADEQLLNPNGIELRLGKYVLFHSTGEEAELEPGKFLQVQPGESVAISSIECIDFSAEAVRKVFPGMMLMGLITPTTTMMREGISQTSTKVDAGFRGILNWGFRNGSVNKITLQYGEPIFKLTVLLLESGEQPDRVYGERGKDAYQNATGIVRSQRRIPADIPKNKVIASSVDKIDPKKQLKDAGYPFNYISTELTELHGKFELVSTDVRLMRDDFDRKALELSKKIESETQTLKQKIDDTNASVLDRVELLFEQKIFRAGATIVGAGPIMYGAYTFLKQQGLQDQVLAVVAIAVGLVVVALPHFFSRRTTTH